MTLKELLKSDRNTLFPTDVAPLLGCSPYAITLTAREHPEKLGFAVSVIGKRTYISRRSLIKFLTGKDEE